MAGGGWSKRGLGIPLEQRSRGDVPTRSAGADGPGDDRAGCPARHCWVAGALDAEGVKRPGLLVEWRWTRVGWEGRVLYCARLRADAWVMVEEWLPADLLTPL